MDEFQKKVREIKDKVNTRGLVINRVPKNTHEIFLKLAEEEFCDDFGMTLKYLLDNFSLWKLLFENLDMKLDNIFEKVSQLEQNEKKPDNTESIRLLSGRTIEKGGIK